MNNGDDINNLLRTLGHDAGIYQDLAKYNASRAASRRAAMVRPVEAAAPAPQAPALASPAPAAPAAPPVLRVVQTSPAGASSLSSILNRLASPQEPAPADGRRTGAVTAAPHPPGHLSPQPARLDRLFGRLATRSAGSPER